MSAAIDIDVDDAERHLPTHWLHAAYAGADAPALIAARKAEVAGLFLGDAKERGVRDACARGDQAYVARACGTLKSLGDLRVPIAAQERCDWARACIDGANVADCVEINQCVGCPRQFFTKSFLGDDAAVLARSSGEEPASPRHRAGVASMAWRSTRRFSTNAP